MTFLLPFHQPHAAFVRCPGSGRSLISRSEAVPTLAESRYFRVFDTRSETPGNFWGLEGCPESALLPQALLICPLFPPRL